MIRQVIKVTFVLLIAAPATVRSQDAPDADAPLPVGESESVGSWVIDGKAQRWGQRWELDVHRGPDNTITGHVNLGDAKLAHSGNLHGQIVGTQVSGAITDDNGNQIATFTGSAGETGIRGSYRDRTGEEGDWSWEGRID